MHLRPWLLLAGWLLPWLVAAQPSFPYFISGRIGPLPATAVIFLRDKQRIIDSAQVRDGRFTLRGTARQPHSVMLLVGSLGRLGSAYRHSDHVPGDALRLFVEPTPVVLTSAGSLFSATVSAGPVNRDFQRYNAQVKALQKELHPYARPLDTYAIPDINALRRDQAPYQQLTRTFIRQNPTSWVSLDLLYQHRLGPAQYDAMAPLYATLSPQLKGSGLGHAYGQQLDSLRTVALGALAPDLTLTAPTGKPVAVRDYRGQYLLLQFWSSQCECHLEFNPTAKVCRRFAGRPLAVLNVSLDEPTHRKQWLRAISEYQLPGTPASNLDGAAGPTARRYRVSELPQNFLLDPTGRILAVNVYGDELASALAKALPAAASPK